MSHAMLIRVYKSLLTHTRDMRNDAFELTLMVIKRITIFKFSFGKVYPRIYSLNSVLLLNIHMPN